MVTAEELEDRRAASLSPSQADTGQSGRAAAAAASHTLSFSPLPLLFFFQFFGGVSSRACVSLSLRDCSVCVDCLRATLTQSGSLL